MPLLQCHRWQHLLSLEALSARYGTQLDAAEPRASGGLSAAEAASRLASHGPNVLTQKKGEPEWRRFLRQFTDPLLVQLLVAGVLCFVAYVIYTGAKNAQVSLAAGWLRSAVISQARVAETRPRR